MKKLNLLSILLFVSSICSSQEEFSPVGAKWVFSYGYNNYEGFEYVTYDRDTIIEEQATKILSRTRRYVEINSSTDTIEENIPDAFIRQDGNRIYQYYLDSFHLIYDFAWGKGTFYEVVNNENITTLGTNGNRLANISLFFDSTYVSSLDGKQLKIITGNIGCEGVDLSFGACITILESVGPINHYLFYTENSCSDESAALFFKTFSINDTLLYSSDEECPIRLISSLEEFDIKKSTFIIYPNPVADILHIKGPLEAMLQVKKLTLFNNLGKEVVNVIGPFDNIITQIDIKTLLPGIYYLSVNSLDRVHHVQKMIIIK